MEKCPISTYLQQALVRPLHMLGPMEEHSTEQNKHHSLGLNIQSELMCHVYLSHRLDDNTGLLLAAFERTVTDGGVLAVGKDADASHHHLCVTAEIWSIFVILFHPIIDLGLIN